MLWESEIELGEKFYQEIVGCPVPLDMHILRAMKRTALGLDLYLWLTYRMFTLKKPIYLPWRQLYWQFGTTEMADKRTVLNFRAQFLRELAKLKDAWPQLDYQTPPGHLNVSSCTPARPESHPRGARRTTNSVHRAPVHRTRFPR